MMMSSTDCAIYPEVTPATAGVTEVKLWGEIQRHSRVFPKKAADGQVYVSFKFTSRNAKRAGKRKALVNFHAECFATGDAWAVFKAKELYMGRVVYIEGHFDEALGGPDCFRVRVLDYENLNRFLYPNAPADFHPSQGFVTEEKEF